MPKLIRCRSCDHSFSLTPAMEDAEDIRCPSCGSHVAGFSDRDRNLDDRSPPRRTGSGSRGSGFKILVGLLVVGGLLVLLCGGGIGGLWWWAAAPTWFPEQTEDYVQARKGFQTKLIRKGAAPQTFDPLNLLEDVNEIEYTSGQLRLKAWVSAPNPNAGPSPAVLFLHGGFAFGEDDWKQTQPFEDAGFVVMIPMLRGENGLPGNYSMFYDEVEDVLAAAEVLARQPNVDGKRMYIAGHDVGGTMALLMAMTTNRFRAAASFSGSPDQVKWIRGQPEVVPFDPANQRELQMRSPLAFPRSFKCPARLYYGNQEILLASSSKKTAELAKAAGLDVEAISVPGNHMTAVVPAMAQCIRFFQQK